MSAPSHNDSVGLKLRALAALSAIAVMLAAAPGAIASDEGSGSLPPGAASTAVRLSAYAGPERYLKIEAIGTSIKLYDGTSPGSMTQRVAAADSTNAAAGQAGLWATAVAFIDSTLAQFDILAAEDTAVAGGCDSTVSSVSAARQAVNGAAGGETICLTDGTYGPMTLDNNSAKSLVRLKAVNPLGAVFRSRVVLGSNVAIDGLDITATGSYASGHCVSIQTNEKNNAILNSHLHDCDRDGISWDRPLQNNSNATTGTLVKGNLIEDVGKRDDAGNSMTIRGDDVSVIDNEMTRGRNDAVNLWGDSHLFQGNYIHDFSNVVGNHNDAFQTWQDYADGYSAAPLTNLIVERNVIENITGPHSHGMMLEGSANANLTVQDNLWDTIGSSASDIQDSPSNVRFLRNTYYNTGAISFSDDGGATGGKLIGNIFAGSTPASITASCSCTAEHNTGDG